MFLYFLHIPKTAGTSARLGLERMLAQSGGHLKHLPLLDDLLRPENSEWTSLDYLTGHLGVVPIVHASPQHVVTLLREPVAHLFSWYWHIRRVPDHHYHQIVTDEGSLTRYSGHLIWAMIRLGGVRYACTEAAGVPASCP